MLSSKQYLAADKKAGERQIVRENDAIFHSCLFLVGAVCHISMLFLALHTNQSIT